MTSHPRPEVSSSTRYMISNVATLLHSLDRHAAEVGEKVDAVKQYVQWRALPRALATRVKKHYKYYYEERAPFDEMHLLDGCPPSLRSELMRFVLRETLGKLPLFRDVIDPEFQSELFPIIKPVSFAPSETIFCKGEPSRELLFLLEGEVDVLSLLDATIIDRRITPREEIFVGAASASTADEPPFAITHSGAFGESVLTGLRRGATHVARTPVKCLVVAKGDLEAVFDRNPRTARRIFHKVLSESRRKERLRFLAIRLLIGLLKRGTPLWGALFVQLAWARYAQRLFRMSLFSHPVSEDDLQTEPSLTGKAHFGIRPPAEKVRGGTAVTAEEFHHFALSTRELVEARVVSVIRTEVHEQIRREFEQLRSELLVHARLVPGPELATPSDAGATQIAPPRELCESGE